jgi:hypothetical protein
LVPGDAESTAAFVVAAQMELKLVAFVPPACPTRWRATTG